MLGIVIILNVFFNVVVALAFPAPEYTAYCPLASRPTVSVEDSKTTCDAQGGTWIDTTIDPGITGGKNSGYCDMYAKCQKPYEDASKQHALYAFVLMLALGIVALIAGLMLPLGSAIVSSGLSYGGVLAFVIGSASYWGDAGNWIRLLISFIGLVVLLYIGSRRFRD